MQNYFLILLTALGVSCSRSREVVQVAPAANTLTPHAKFHISLPENHSNGYLWQLRKTFDNHTTEYINSVWHGNEKGVAFNFESGEPGNTRLEFDLIKYKDTLESRVFIIDVK